MRVGFKYYQDEDRMVFDTSVTKLLPGDNVIAPFVSNIEMGAKVHTEDCERAISFFTSNFDFSHGNYTFLRILDRSGNFPWFQVSVSERNGDGCLIGSIEPLNSETVSESNAYRLAFFNNLKDFLNEIPIYDVPNLFLIKLTDYKTLSDIKGSELANKAFEDALAVVKGVLRSSDVVAPAGDGVIFAYLLGVKDDMILCDRATSIISSLRISWGAYSENLKEVVSIGISTVKHDGTMNIAELYAKAAVALVSAEEKHKNTYALYSDNVKGEEQFVGKNVSLHDIELVKNILDPIKTWAYAVDERLHLIYKNDALSERIPGESLGYCYKLLKGNNKQCEDCPLKKFENDISSVDADVYSPGLRRVIHTRTTRLRMRNNIKVYIIADTKEDIGAQLEALKESTKHYNKAMQKIQDIIWEIDLETLSCIRIREENILSMVEKRVEDFEGLRDYYMNHVVYPDDTEDFMYATSPAHLREIARIGREMVDSKVRFLYQDGTYHWYSLSAIFEEDKVFLVARDINDLSHDIVQDYVTSRRFREIKTDSQARSELAKNYERSEHVNELTGIYVFEYDAAEKDYYLSTTFENMFEVTDNMLSGEWTLLEGLPPHTDDREKYENFLHRVRSGSDTHEITIRLVNKYNVALWFTITVQTLKGIGNSLARITGCIQDVNTEMEIKQELEFRADYDSLTGLFNSESFYRSVEERLLMRPDSKFAIISVDIDRFRIINDRFGVEAGNACLRELGRVIHSSLPWDGLAARYQADMYSILYEYNEEHELLEYIEKLTLSFHVDEATRCGSTLSYGIYKIDERNISVRLMCDRARLAKKNIKGTTLTNFNVYDDNIRLKDNQQAELESEMEIALERHEFVMFLQPKVSLETGKICGAEALVRWMHPLKGIRMPGDFLPLFESNGFIKKIDEFMWEETAKYLARLKELKIEIPVSVNVSRLHIGNTDLVTELSALVKKYDIDPKKLELEITETLFTEDTGSLYDTMQQLKDIGFTIEMDDFGSGYSSLNMLKDAPVDVIKIDRFFLDEVIDTKRGKIIVANSIKMSKELGMRTIAEGVETKEQAEFLRDAGCDIAQGYYYSKPIPTSEFEEMLDAESRA
ncbi:MAG: bifunctional diguanylate cyclase/phosphodiesterase [Lachnospiraceae bacterium]|nr:bifunctional diguanylate cyclase/phosphodiesterase [Lachnospiraceae bacterium]